MKPGETTRPLASMVFFDGARMRPISVILPAVMPTSAERAGAPVPSTTLPPLMRGASMTRLSGQNTAMKVAIIGGDPPSRPPPGGGHHQGGKHGQSSAGPQ